MSLTVASSSVKCKQLDVAGEWRTGCHTKCWTLNELKAELRRRKARLSGRKFELLVERFAFICHLGVAVIDKRVSLARTTPPCRVGLRMNYEWPTRELTFMIISLLYVTDVTMSYEVIKCHK